MSTNDLAVRRATLKEYRHALAMHRYAIGEALKGAPWPPSDDRLAELVQRITDGEVRAAIRADRDVAAGSR